MTTHLFRVLLLVGVCASTSQAADKPDQTIEFFKPVGKIPTFKIEVDKTNLAQLNREPRKYVKCTLKVGDDTYNDVAIHLKGAAGSYRNWDDRPALTLNMDKFVNNQNLKGLDKFHLNNSVQDGTLMNEIMCGRLALAANLPACRGTHAMVELNGRKVGMYVLKEGFDKAFLKRHFADPNGNLYDGGFLQDVDAPLQLDHGKENDRKDLKALVAASREPNAEKRFAAFEKLVDIDRFVADAALQVIATDWDGYMRNRNNYRVYFDPKSGKATFFPHGMDQMFQNPGEGIYPGWGGLVARSILDTPEGKKRYIAKLREMTEKYFVVADWHKTIDEYAARVKDALEANQKGSSAGFMNEIRAYKDRIKQRSDVLKRELAKEK
jgi:hypothetical protein